MKEMVPLGWSYEQWVENGSQQAALIEEKQVKAVILPGLPRRTISLQEISLFSLQDQGLESADKSFSFQERGARSSFSVTPSFLFKGKKLTFAVHAVQLLGCSL